MTGDEAMQLLDLAQSWTATAALLAEQVRSADDPRLVAGCAGGALACAQALRHHVAEHVEVTA